MLRKKTYLKKPNHQPKQKTVNLASLEQELFEIAEKFRSVLLLEQESTSLSQVCNLYFKAKEKYLAIKKEQRTEEVKRSMLVVFFLAGRITENFIAEWQNGKIEPTEQEIELLKKGCKEVLEAFDNHFKLELLAWKKKPYKIHRAEVEEKISRIRELIQQYKAK